MLHKGAATAPQEVEVKKDDPEIRLRVPRQLRDWLRTAAATNRRSMSGEAEYRLEQAMRAEQSGSRGTGNQAGGEALRA